MRASERRMKGYSTKQCGGGYELLRHGIAIGRATDSAGIDALIAAHEQPRQTPRTDAAIATSNAWDLINTARELERENVRLEVALRRLVMYRDAPNTDEFADMAEDATVTGMSGREYEDMLYGDARAILAKPASET